METPFISQDKVTDCEALYREIQATAEKVRDLYCSIRSISTEYLYFNRIDFDDGVIYFRGDEYWKYGGHDVHTLELPLSYLYTTDWIDEEKAKIEVAKQAEIDAENAATERRRLNELAQLEKLQAKYPDHNR